MTSDFLLALDADSFDNNKSRIVDHYERAWWKGRKPWSIDLTEILDRSSIGLCLKDYQKQLLAELGNVRSQMPKGPKSPASINPSSDHTLAESKTACDQCAQYSEILSDTLHNILNTHQLANAMCTISESQWKINMRRASTFNLLHEAAIMKETADIGNNQAFIGADITKSVAENAKLELERLQALPPTSHKWTWGERLTKTEVLNLRRSGTKPLQRSYSGYDLSLITGPITGQDSSAPSMPSSTIANIQMPADSSSALPSYNIPGLSYFEMKKNLSYDPLGTSRLVTMLPIDSSAVPSASAELNAENLSLHAEMLSMANISNDNSITLEGIVKDSETAIAILERQLGTEADDETPVMGAEDGDGTSAMGIEVLWVSGSDGENGTPAVGIENQWLSGSDSNDETPAVGIEHQWSSGSEADAETPAMGIENKWSSGSDAEDETPALGIEKEWQSASDAEEKEAVAERNENEGESDHEVNEEHQGIEHAWSSASEKDVDIEADISSADPLSSQPIYNSDYVTSPSRITINRQQVSFPWPDLNFDGQLLNSSQQNTSSLETSGVRPVRHFGPEDFSNLQDHMFEDKLSESEDEIDEQ